MNNPKIGDIYRWSWNKKTLEKYKDKESAGTLYWCCSRICVFQDDGKFRDTYWLTRSENKSFTPQQAEEMIEIKYVANFDDLVAANKYDRAYYEDKDFVDISHANNTTGGFYLRKGAVKSLEKMRRVMQRNINKLQRDADYAQRAVNQLKIELEKMSVHIHLPLLNGVSLIDYSYEDDGE